MSENKTTYNFGEKKEEYSAKQKKNVPVWKSPKYEQSKTKAIELITKGGFGLKEGDFWILMNETKGGKMAYTGLIISHNACLKINDKQAKDLKFKPECVCVDKDGYNNSLVHSYSCPEQDIYEVGEVSSNNCKNAYPYAMSLKRLFDRAVLKISKIAFEGIYSETEAEEFKEQPEAPEKAETDSEKMDVGLLIRNTKTLKGLVEIFNQNQVAINGDKTLLEAIKTKKAEIKAAAEAKKAEVK